MNKEFVLLYEEEIEFSTEDSDKIKFILENEFDKTLKIIECILKKEDKNER